MTVKISKKKLPSKQKTSYVIEMSNIRSLLALFYSVFFSIPFLFSEEIAFHLNNPPELSWVQKGYHLPSQKIGKIKAIVLISDQESMLKNTHLTGIHFNGLKLPGSSYAKKKFINHLKRQFIYQNLSLDDLEELKCQISFYYKNQGNAFVRLTYFPQDVTDGILHLIVTETRVANVRAYDNEWSSAHFTKKTIGLKKGDRINTNQVHTALAFLNHNPFKRTDALFSPGQKANTTNLELITKEKRPYRIYTGTDNRGNETISSYRQFEGFTLGNLFNLNQVFSYQFTTSLPFKHMHAHAGYYEVPLPHRMSFVAFGGYSSIHTKAFSEGMHNTGYNIQASGRYHAPLFPWKKATNDIAFGFDYKRTNNNLLFSETPIIAKTATLSQFVLSYQLDDRSQSGIGLFDFEFFFSPVKWFNDQTAADYQLLSPYATPYYFYFLTSWEKNFTLPHCMRLFARIKGQYANKNLLPSEQLGLGGFDTVRGYFEREINGENGFLINLELKSPLFSLFKRKMKCDESRICECENVTFDELQMVGFFDFGFVNRHHKIAGAHNTQAILGVGPGLKYIIDPFLSATLYWGFRLKSAENQSAPGGRLHFSLVGSY